MTKTGDRGGGQNRIGVTDPPARNDLCLIRFHSTHHIPRTAER